MMPQTSLAAPENDQPSSNNNIQSLSIQAEINNNIEDDDEYQDFSTNDLSMFTGAILLIADCMGTGILALPADVQLLGRGWGIAFLLFNLPINLYAGTILGHCALFVEERILGESKGHLIVKSDDDACDNNVNNNDHSDTNEAQSNRRKNVNNNDDSNTPKSETQSNRRKRKGYSSVEIDTTNSSNREIDENLTQQPTQRHTDTATFDYVGMTSMLFDEQIPTTESFENAFDPDFTIDDDGNYNESQQQSTPRQITYKHPFTKGVLAIYYINLFLVLGNYILVMSHAVSAMAGGDNLCIPTAGIVASTLMFGLSQMRTMANLGRSVSAVSLLALLIVVAMCLVSLRDSNDETEVEEEEELEYSMYTTTDMALAKMSSLASICFAVGSQKLLLNIRHEMSDRTKAAPGALSLSLSTYGLAYIVVCILAGSHPPSFLFDAIPEGIGRRVAGLLLWIHVAVSYAINSQAFCSSMDRVLGHRLRFCGLRSMHRVRWMILTALVAISSFLVANAIPFFKDLVAFCGAATSIPLTLLIPALFYRRVQNVPLLFPTLHSKYSFLLVIFSIVFMVIGLVGALGSIDVDWQGRSGPFACH